MVKKSKKTKTVKTTKKDPSNAAVLKKVSTIADSTKTLSKEIKSMARIFSENQKVLVTMKNMMSSLATAIEHVQKQSKQINVIEKDTEKLYAGLNQVRGQASLVEKINSQTNKLQEQIKKIQEEQKTGPRTEKIIQAVADSANSIKNNSKMIMSISDRIENVKENLKKVSERTEVIPTIPGLDDIKNKVESMSGITSQIDELKRNIQSISSRTGNLGGDITNLKNQLGNVITKADSLANMGENLNAVKKDVSILSDLLNRSEASTSEFHKKTDQLFQELQRVKNVTNKASTDTSKDVFALLKLSEYQSTIRIHSESKYGGLEDLEKMASETAEIVNLFDKISIESQEKIALPNEVRQWAVSKILDCADRWEIRFSDVLSLLSNQLGRDLLKDSIRIKQVRDIFGIRAVDEIRQELGLQTPSDAS